MIKLQGIAKSFPNGKTVLDGISLNLPERGMVFVTGAGSPTLLNIIGGIDRPSGGELFFRNSRIRTEKELDRYRSLAVGYIFPRYTSFRGTVLENLEFAASLTRQSPEDIDSALRQVALTDVSRDVHFLNGGETVKMNIARALLKKPAVLLAEEPTHLLNADEEKEVMGILKEISSNALVIIASTKETLAKTYADRILPLADGRLLDESLPQESTGKGELPRGNFGFSWKQQLQTVAVNIKKSPLLTFLFCLCTIIFLGLTFTVNVLRNIDGAGLLLEDMAKHHVNYGEIYRIQENYYSRKIPFSKALVQELENTHPQHQFYKMYIEDCHIYMLDCGGQAEIPEEHETYNFIHGDIPDNYTEFFITKKYAEELLIWAQMQGFDVNSLEDLIGYQSPGYQDLTLAGIVDADLPDFLYFLPGYLETRTNESNYCHYLYFKISGDYQADYEIFAAYYGDDNYFRVFSKNLIIKNPVTSAHYPSLAVYDYMANKLEDQLIVFMILALILYLLNMHYSLRIHRRKNWLWRILGCTNADLWRIYMAQNLIPFVIIIPLAFVAGLLRIENINEIYRYQVRFHLYSVNFLSVLKVFLLALPLIVLGILLPWLRFRNTYPLDLLRLPRWRQKRGEYYLDVKYWD